ncbi:MAG TPA: DUF3108 domain-containing protein [Gemmatimonadales bacterium]
MTQVIRAALVAASLVTGPAATHGPFAAETLRYEASLGIIPAGTATLRASETVDGRGRRLSLLTLEAAGGRGALSASARMTSWAGGAPFVSHRFHRQTELRGRRTDDRYRIEADSGLYRIEGKDGAWVTPDRPLDELAMLYYLRTLDLAPGQDFILRGYFRNGYNPVRVRVVGRERVELGSGAEVSCLRLEVSAAGLSSDVWLTDDAKRIPARLRVPTPIGRVAMVWDGGT